MAARQIPQTLNYAEGGIQVADKPEASHAARPTTARMADLERVESQVRPMTTKTVSLNASKKRSVSVDPQNAPPPPPGAPAVAALGTMNLGEGSAVPAWVAFDGQTLAFEAYFVEPAVDGRDRPRRCVLRYYLEDGTVDVCEPKTDNSGLEQGRLLKRHRAVAANGAPSRTPTSSSEASSPFYGRAYHVVGCDAFTREFLVREGITVAPDGVVPRALVDEGPGVLGTIGMGVRGVGGRRRRRRGARRRRGRSRGRERGSEDGRDGSSRASLLLRVGRPRERRRGVELRAQLLSRGRDGGGSRGAVAERRAGSLPRRCWRSRACPRTARSTSACPARGDWAPDPAHVSHRHLRVGGTVGVYGRTLTIHDCDDFTRAFYVKEEGRTIAEMAPRPFVESAPRLTPTIPPHNGFGSEVDSLANCVSLVPKRAPFDVRNFEKNDGKNLVFTAQFEGASEGRATPPNDERRFIVTFYLVDNTVSVYEPPVVNSGVVGGKFLERDHGAGEEAGVPRAIRPTRLSRGQRHRAQRAQIRTPRHRRRHGEDHRRARGCARLKMHRTLSTHAVDQRVSPVPKNVNRRDVYSTRCKK